MRFVIGLAVSAVIFGVGMLARADRDESGAIVDAGAIPVMEMSQGDCFNDETLANETETEVQEVSGVPCAQPHTYEVYATFEHPGGAYPGDDALFYYGADECERRFATFVGTPLESSPFDIVLYYPLDASWAAGDRLYVCALYALDDSPLIGSMAGAAP